MVFSQEEMAVVCGGEFSVLREREGSYGVGFPSPSGFLARA